MRYSVRGLEVRSENAAQATDRPAQHLVELLRAEQGLRHSLDYGCGKLRYTGLLAERSTRVTIVDSDVQLGRVQPLGRENTSIREYIAQHWPNCRALTVHQFHGDRTRYDFVLCANVLSAIPDYDARGRAIEAIRDHLTRAGRALFVTQYRDASFTERITAGRAQRYRNGWLVADPNRPTFYEMIDSDHLQRLLIRHGLHTASAHIHDKSAYVFATHD